MIGLDDVGVQLAGRVRHASSAHLLVMGQRFGLVGLANLLDFLVREEGATYRASWPRSMRLGLRESLLYLVPSRRSQRGCLLTGLGVQTVKDDCLAKDGHEFQRDRARK
jgi:hypothetical protein